MMISKRPQPVIGKFNGTCSSGCNQGSVVSPRSPLEITKIQSPKSPKKYDFAGGVGLGIVAALVKSEHVDVAHHSNTDKPVFTTSNQSRSKTIPVEMENHEEDDTFVTCHGPKKTNTTCTTVYYDGVTRENNIRLDRKCVKKHGCVIFDISSARFSDYIMDTPVSDFLSFCHLCRKTLHGKDIYMYRGEKSFCSKECRYTEIVKDEHKEKQKCKS